MFEIPSQFQKTHYNAHILPKEGKPLDLSVGANCQVYAYAVLTHFGKHPPLLRSSQLWTDQCQTIPVTILQPLALIWVYPQYKPINVCSLRKNMPILLGQNACFYS